MLAGSCIWSAVSKYQNGMPKVVRKAFNMGEAWNPVWHHGNRTVKLILWRTFSRIFCKKSKISDTNWLRYLFSSYLNKIWLSVWRHHLANLYGLKTLISLEWKEILKKSKQHFSSHADYLIMFQNGVDRKDVIFVGVPLKKEIATKLQKISQPEVKLSRKYLPMMTNLCLSFVPCE